MAVPCPYCGRQYDVTLFQFERTILCDCGHRVHAGSFAGDTEYALSQQELRGYLRRVGLAQAPRSTWEGLATLHWAQLLHIPFETLDVFLKRPISLRRVDLFEKLVVRGRGGFCYELNLLFAAALRALGFRCDLIAGEVRSDRGGFGPAFDHMAVVVRIDEQPWLADVGFGDGFERPLSFDHRWHSQRRGSSFRIVSQHSRWLLETRAAGSLEPKPCYRFDTIPRRPEDYAEMCDYHSRDDDSPFAGRWICSRMQPRGRIWLQPGKRVETLWSAADGERRRERALEHRESFVHALESDFGIVNFDPPGRWFEPKSTNS